MDTKQLTSEQFQELPIALEITYRDAITSYRALMNDAEGRIDRLDVEERVRYLTTLAVALSDINAEIKTLHVVRKINDFKEEDFENLQIVSRMGFDDEGKPKYIVERSPIDIPIEDRNMNDSLFRRDRRHLMTLKTKFEEALSYYKGSEQ